MSFVGGVGSLQQEVSPAGYSEAVQTIVPTDKTTEVAIANVQHGDLTELSSTGGLVAQALGGSDVRAGKVASLQQAIADGSYNVSSADVADKIIQSLLG
jgi:negative regulator of flagellin synthesis FlgM